VDKSNGRAVMFQHKSLRSLQTAVKLSGAKEKRRRFGRGNMSAVQVAQYKKFKLGGIFHLPEMKFPGRRLPMRRWHCKRNMVTKE